MGDLVFCKSGLVDVRGRICLSFIMTFIYVYDIRDGRKASAKMDWNKACTQGLAFNQGTKFSIHINPVIHFHGYLCPYRKVQCTYTKPMIWGRPTSPYDLSAHQRKDNVHTLWTCIWYILQRIQIRTTLTHWHVCIALTLASPGGLKRSSTGASSLYNKCTGKFGCRCTVTSTVKRQMFPKVRAWNPSDRTGSHQGNLHLKGRLVRMVELLLHEAWSHDHRAPPLFYVRSILLELF